MSSAPICPLFSCRSNPIREPVKMNRGLRNFLISVGVGIVIGSVLYRLRSEVNDLLGNLPASSIIPFVAALSPVLVFAVNERKSIRDARRAQWRKIKADVLDRWSPNNLGRVSYADGKVSPSEPTDPDAYTDLPPKIREKIPSRFPELLRAWSEAKIAHAQMNRDMAALYQEFQNRVESLRKECSLPDYDSESPVREVVYPTSLYVSVYAQATARNEGQKIGQPFMITPIEPNKGQLYRGGLIIATGPREICEWLKARMESFVELPETKQLLGEIKAMQNKLLDSPARNNFEQKLKETINELEWD